MNSTLPDWDFYFDIVSGDGTLLKYIPAPYNDDDSIVYYAIINNPDSIHFASDRLKDKLCVFTPLIQNGHFLVNLIKNNSVHENLQRLKNISLSDVILGDIAVILMKCCNTLIAHTWSTNDSFSNLIFS